MADTPFVAKNGLVANGIFTANSTQFGITGSVTANTTAITVGSATVNSTVYTGTANNTSFVGSVSAANVVSNAQLSANLANYQTTAGLAANVAMMTANNTTYVGSIAAANVVSNAQLSSNLANYQTTAGLAANVAKLSANNASYLGGTIASGYQTTAGLAANVATMTANAAVFSNGPTFIVRGGGASAEGGQLVLGYGNNLASAITGQSNNTWNIDVDATNTFRIFSVAANGTIAVPFYMYDNGTGVFNGSANNTSYLGGTAAASYQLNSTLAANVAKLSANNASYLGGTAAASYITTGSTPTFDRVISSNNGLGTNYQVGDDAWIGDINLSSTIRVMGVTTGANGYIVFGNTDTTALGRAGSANLTYGGYTVLLSNNFNNYAPTLTGTGASGTWNITANNAAYLGGVAAADYQTEYGLAANVATMTANAATYATYMPTTGLGQNTVSDVVPAIGNTAQWSDWPVGYTAILNGGVDRGNPATYPGTFIKIGKNFGQEGWVGLWCTAATTPQECYVGMAANNTSYATWTRLLTDDNFNEYAPTTTGTGASGTWNITANNAAYLGAVAANNYARLNAVSTFASNVEFSTGVELHSGNTTIKSSEILADNISVTTNANVGALYTTAGAVAAIGGVYTGYLRSGDGAAPLYMITVDGGTTPQAGVVRGTGTNGSLVIRNGGSGAFQIVTNATSGSSGGTLGFQVSNAQNVTIPNGNLSVTGNIAATGSITANYSDRRLKKDLVRINDWRSIIGGLIPYRFKWNDTALDLMKEPDTSTQVGFIAQDIQKVLPQAVAEQTATPEDKVPADGQYLTVLPEKIIPILTAAVQDLIKEVEALRTEIIEMRNKQSEV